MDRLPTFGELERDLSQKIHKLYKEELEHSPDKIISKFFDNRLTIVIEDALTAVEKTLASEDNEQIVEKINSAISDIMKPKLKTLIETVVSVEVEDILFDSTIETKRTGAIVILSQVPQVRTPKSNWKIPKIQPKNEQNGSQADNDLVLTSESQEQETLSG